MEELNKKDGFSFGPQHQFLINSQSILNKWWFHKKRPMLQQLPQWGGSLSLFSLQEFIISEGNWPSLKGFLDPRAERKKKIKTNWHFCLGKDSFYSSWERLLAGCCCCCDLYPRGYLKPRTRFSFSSLMCSHSDSWHKAATYGMLCFTDGVFQGMAQNGQNQWEALECSVVVTRLHPRCFMGASTWTFSRSDRPHTWADVWWVLARWEFWGAGPGTVTFPWVCPGTMNSCGNKASRHHVPPSQLEWQIPFCTI